MRRWARVACGVAGVVGATGIAGAQPAPQDPYAPVFGPQPPPTSEPPKPGPATTPTPTPAPAPEGDGPTADPILDEEVAQSLVRRAQELYDAHVYTDAKQLATEALSKSPRGAAAEHAKFLLHAIDEQLGVEAKPPVDLTPIEDPTKHPRERPAPVAELPRAHRLTTTIHAALYTGLIGATIGAFFDESNPAGGAVPTGLATGAAGGVFLPMAVDRLHWNEGQVRTVGSGSVWGGVIGGLFGDIGKTRGTTARQVLVGASIGATVGGIGGVVLARDNRYSPGDIALVDTLAGIGAVGGLTVGMLMQPVETEAYSLNSVFGVAGGVVAGLIAAPQTNTTPRRMVVVAGTSLLGGALPFLLYAGIHDPSSTDDERLVGALSSVGLVAGAYLGFRLTSDLDRGLDVSPKADDDDAPPALVTRNSSGRWALGAPAIQPLSSRLAPQHGAALTLVGAKF